MKKKQLLSILLALSVSMNSVLVWGMEEEKVISNAEEMSTIAEESGSEQEGESVQDETEEIPADEIQEDNVQNQDELQDNTTIQEQLDLQTETEVTDQQVTTYETAEATDAIEFPDKRVRECLLQDCDHDSDGVLSEEELDDVETFYFDSFRVDLGTEPLNLEGLQYLKNLDSISINLENQIEIEDISVLSDIFANRNMWSVYINYAGLTDCSFVEKAKSIISLDLSNNNIQDISALSKIENPNIRTLDLSYNNISDISAISNIRISDLYMSYNCIEDITPFGSVKPLTEGENIGYAKFDHNQITTLPETWTNLLWIVSLDLSYNKLSSVKALYPRFVEEYAVSDIFYSYGTDISNNQTLTIENVFNELFDDRQISVLVGNKVELPSFDEIASAYTGYGDIDDLLDMIDFQLENSEIAEFSDNHTIQGKQSGKTEIIVTLNDCVKKIPLEVLGTIEPVETVREKTSGIQAVFDGGCAVWNEEGTLWDIHDMQEEKVADRVTSYIADVVYSQDRKEKWSNYYVLNEDHELVYYRKDGPDNKYNGEVLYQNVQKFKLDWYSDLFTVLTMDNELYDCYTGEKVADSVDQYMCEASIEDTGKKCYFVAYTQNKELISEDGIVETNVDEVYFDSEFLTTFFRKGNTIYCYDSEYDYYNQKRIYSVEMVTDQAERIIGDNQFLDLQGRRCLWEKKTENQYNVEILEEESYPYPAVKIVYRAYPTVILDSKKQLWTEIYNSEKQGDEYTLIAKDVDDVEIVGQRISGMLEVMYLSNDRLLSLDGEIVHTDIAEVTESYYRKTDGTVYEFFDENESNQILSDVVSISQPYHWIGRMTYLYMVRKDGSVWKYDSCEGPDAVPHKVMEANSIKGDIDGDGKVSVADLLKVLHHISGSMQLETGQENVADIDNDGMVSIRDLLRMLHYISGTSSEL